MCETGDVSHASDIDEGSPYRLSPGIDDLSDCCRDKAEQRSLDRDRLDVCVVHRCCR